jgi:hypothetical protein
MKLLRMFVGVALILAGCAKTLPDQDLRITEATPQIKVSADILWKDYQSDRAAANRRYHGKAVLVTGVTTGIEKSSPASRFVMFGQTNGQPPGVQANLLTDTADQVLAGLEPKQRITLKCFCDGLSTNLVLKSCTKP